jgi:hypothetical protein
MGVPKKKKRSMQALPTSGSERDYTWSPYGTKRGIAMHNCYAYSRGHYDIPKSCKNGVNSCLSYGKKLQPGELAGNSSDFSLATCKPLQERILGDIPSDVYSVKDASTACKKGYYKIMAFLAPHRDYHFYTQHSRIIIRARKGDTLASIAKWFGVPRSRVALLFPSHRNPTTTPLRKGDFVKVTGNMWSHKRGTATGPLLIDSCKKPIGNPLTSFREFGSGLNYSKP